jgi:hypothetical protein
VIERYGELIHKLHKLKITKNKEIFTFVGVLSFKMDASIEGSNGSRDKEDNASIVTIVFLISN